MLQTTFNIDFCLILSTQETWHHIEKMLPQPLSAKLGETEEKTSKTELKNQPSSPVKKPRLNLHTTNSTSASCQMSCFTRSHETSNITFLLKISWGMQKPTLKNYTQQSTQTSLTTIASIHKAIQPNHKLQLSHFTRKTAFLFSKQVWKEQGKNITWPINWNWLEHLLL